MLILTYFSLASKLQTLWSKDCAEWSIKQTNLVWKQDLNGFDQFYVRVSPCWHSISLYLLLPKLRTGTDMVQLHSNSLVRRGGAILINTKLPLKPPVTACIRRASPSITFWWNPGPHATYFPLSDRCYWGGNFCIFSRDLHILSSSHSYLQDGGW